MTDCFNFPCKIIYATSNLTKHREFLARVQIIDYYKTSGFFMQSNFNKTPINNFFIFVAAIKYVVAVLPMNNFVLIVNILPVP